MAVPLPHVTQNRERLITAAVIHKQKLVIHIHLRQHQSCPFIEMPKGFLLIVAGHNHTDLITFLSCLIHVHLLRSLHFLRT